MMHSLHTSKQDDRFHLVKLRNKNKNKSASIPSQIHCGLPWCGVNVDSKCHYEILCGQKLIKKGKNND
jgi:hypothetical protein